MEWRTGRLTLRAGVRVPSTSKRQIVFLTGRSWSGGMTAPAMAIFASVIYCIRKYVLMRVGKII